MDNYLFNLTCADCGGELEHKQSGVATRVDARAMAHCIECGRTWPHLADHGEDDACSDQRCSAQTRRVSGGLIMIERCGQEFGGMGYKAACRYGQSHRCDLVGAHMGRDCTCACGAVLTKNDSEAGK